MAGGVMGGIPSTSPSPHLHWSFWHGNLLPLRHARCWHEAGDQRRRTILWLEVTVAIKKLLPPPQIMLQDIVKFRLARNRHHALVEFIRWAKALGIPRRD